MLTQPIAAHMVGRAAYRDEHLDRACWWSTNWPMTFAPRIVPPTVRRTARRAIRRASATAGTSAADTRPVLLGWPSCAFWSRSSTSPTFSRSGPSPRAA
nr:hypothetical protein [Demequina litorisediminis]